MGAARAVPAVEADSANDLFKGRFRSWFWSCMIFAVLVHFGAFSYWPELTAADMSFTSAELTAIEMPPEIEIPPAPEAISRPAVPVMATAEVDEDITIAPTTFEENPIEALPPPPSEDESVRDLSAQPTFTPFTVAPRILNRNEVLEAMVAAYPPLLRDAHIGGTVYVFFFIDRDGRVADYRIDQSSGHVALDEAALAVAGLYRFSPALNRDERVPVWVSFPIEFQVR